MPRHPGKAIHAFTCNFGGTFLEPSNQDEQLNLVVCTKPIDTSHLNMLGDKSWRSLDLR